MIGLIAWDRATRERAAKSTDTISQPRLFRVRPRMPDRCHAFRRKRSRPSSSRSLRDHLKLTDPIDDRALIDTYVQRIDVEPAQLSLTLSQPATPGRRQPRTPQILRIPWRKPPSKLRRELLRPATPQHQTRRPIRAETRAALVAAIARGRQWLNELLTDPATTIDLIAVREHCTPRKINMTISLAFLAPDLVKAALDGRLPDGIGIARLADMPAEWHRQYQALGLATPLSRSGITPPSSMKATSAPIAIGETGICGQRIMPQNRAIRLRRPAETILTLEKPANGGPLRRLRDISVSYRVRGGGRSRVRTGLREEMGKIMGKSCLSQRAKAKNAENSCGTGITVDS